MTDGESRVGYLGAALHHRVPCHFVTSPECASMPEMQT